MPYSIDSMIILGVKTAFQPDEDRCYQLPDGTYTHDLESLRDRTILCSTKKRGKLGCVGPLSQGSKNDVFVLGYLLSHRETEDLLPKEINLEKLAHDVQQLRPRVLQDINSHGFTFLAKDIRVYHAIDNELWRL